MGHPFREETDSFVQCRKFFEEAADFDVLGADSLASSAFETFACFCVIHDKALVIHIGFLAGNRMEIEKTEVFRNIDADRAFFHAVFTVGARYPDGPVQDFDDLFHQLFFFPGKGFELTHERGVVIELFKTAHTA